MTAVVLLGGHVREYILFTYLSTTIPPPYIVMSTIILTTAGGDVRRLVVSGRVGGVEWCCVGDEWSWWWLWLLLVVMENHVHMQPHSP